MRNADRRSAEQVKRECRECGDVQRRMMCKEGECDGHVVGRLIVFRCVWRVWCVLCLCEPLCVSVSLCVSAQLPRHGNGEG